MVAKARRNIYLWRMKDKMTTGEVRGLVSAIVIVAVVVLAAAWNNGAFERGDAAEPRSESTGQEISDSLKAKISSLDDTIEPKGNDASPKIKNRKKRAAKTHNGPKPERRRSYLDEPVDPPAKELW